MMAVAAVSRRSSFAGIILILKPRTMLVAADTGLPSDVGVVGGSISQRCVGLQVRERRLHQQSQRRRRRVVPRIRCLRSELTPLR